MHRLPLANGGRRRAPRHVLAIACALVAAGLLASVASAAPSPTPRCGRLQALIDAARPNSVVTVPPCVYRETIRISKPLTIQTTGGEIRGSDVWTAWRATSTGWVSTRSVPAFRSGGVCQPGTTACTWPEQVFVDGEPLTQVAGLPGHAEFAIDAKRHVLMSDDPAGHTVEVTTRTRWVDVRADHVTIDGFRMRHAANLPQGENGALLVASASWFTLRRSILSDAHGALLGIVGGTGHRILANDLYRAGEEAFGLPGVSDTVVARNRIHYNNTEWFDPGWEAGGGKAGEATNLVFDANDVYANDGPGLWCDISCSAVTFSSNRLHGNARMGLLLEVSTGAIIEGNAVWSNGFGDPAWGWGAGIVLSSSADADVHDNTVAWNADGISIVSQDRPGHTVIAGNVVHDNTIVLEPRPERTDDASLLGWLQDWPGALYAADSGNRGFDNLYWSSLAEPSWSRFVWNGSVATLSAFNSTPGEEGGRYLSVAERDLLLAAAGIPLAP